MYTIKHTIIPSIVILMHNYYLLNVNSYAKFTAIKTNIKNFMIVHPHLVIRKKYSYQPPNYCDKIKTYDNN